MIRNPVAFIALCLATICVGQAADVKPDIYHVGVAKIDITPDHPIRLNGFGFRRSESEGVNHRIHVRAVSIRHDSDTFPVVLMTADILGIPDVHRNELARRLKAKANLPGERLAVMATHTHCGPMLRGANVTLFGQPIPVEHLKNIDSYTVSFLDKLEAAALASLKDPQPCHLYWGVGSVGFAKNRRNANGPKDHDLPVLIIRDAKTRQVKAVYTSYACHCVTLSHNRIGGDWAGYAAEAIEAQHADAVGLVSIGCGADQNPDSGVVGDKVEAAQIQGRSIATEIQRLTKGFLAPLKGKLTCTGKSQAIPLADLPERKVWEEKAKRDDAIGYHAKMQLARLNRNEQLATSINYVIQTWTFGDSLAFVQLPGEVVVDYSLRLKDELDRSRLWITAYANANPCYIPSERVLKAGGYEGGGAMVYYDVPVPFKAGLEEAIIGEVKRQLGAIFAAKIDSKRTRGEKPLSPQQSLAAIKTESRFTVELAVAEPLVADPVAISFGSDGKLWVAEMLDYPNGRHGNFEPGGRIRCIEQTDGHFDRASTFLDNLPFPTGVLPWRKGLLICAAPDILYAEDTNGDNKADIVTKLFSGFGTDNYQARVNGLAYGLDGWVYGSSGLFGGNILSHKTGKTLVLGGRDFRLNPDTGAIEPATGRSQQGRVRDDWGNWFGCDNSNLAFHYVLADQDLRRNPYVAPPSPIVGVIAESQLFPLRTPQLFKLSGPAGRPTGACGIGFYRDELLGRDLSGNVFICEPVNLLVNRRIVSPKGSSFQGKRAASEADREFLSSSDSWFRPVQATTGPDGALWIVDMYRFVIEHPRWIPPADLAAVDVRAGAGLGRLYRVLPADKPSRLLPRLDKLDTSGLVAALDSPNGWQRDMATQLLEWRNDKSANAKLISLSKQSTRAEARLHAMIVLEQFGGLTAEILASALHDASPGVRRHAVRLAEPFLNDDLGHRIAALSHDDDAQVRLQVAVTLAAWNSPSAVEALAKLALQPDPFLQSALLSSLHRGNLQAFVSRPEITALAPSALLPKLILTATGLKSDAALATLLDHVTSPRKGSYQPWQYVALRTYLDAKKEKNHPAAVTAMLGAARKLVFDEKTALALRVAATPLLGLDDLASLLVPQTPGLLQDAAIVALGRLGGDGVPSVLLASWTGYSPQLQGRVVEVLLKRDVWLQRLLAAISEGKVPASALSARDRQLLLTHANATIRKHSESVFAGAANSDRKLVIEAYRASLPNTGDAAKGQAIYLKSCSACHKIDTQGHAVGPDLAGLANKTAEYLLAEILDPNRNLDNRYLEYHAETVDGRTLTGLLFAEAASAVTLRQADGKDVALLRSDLESLKSTNRSLMPEGFEKDIPPASMADLLAFLGTAHLPATSDPVAIAKYILDDSQNTPDREALIARHADKSAALITAMAKGIGTDEYRRIPWLWRVAIAAGKRNRTDELLAILKVSLPQEGEALRDWQAVVIGGGLINGISQNGVFPGTRFAEVVSNGLTKRWSSAISASVVMADNAKVPNGTRYDALRMIPMLGGKDSRKQLEKYLAKGTHAELQMGAVSGLVDVDDFDATQALVAALNHLPGGNRTLALQGLLRTDSRASALLDAVEAGHVRPASIDASIAASLKQSKSDSIRLRAQKLLNP